MIRSFTFKRAILDHEFEVSKLSHWLEEHPRAAIVSSAMDGIGYFLTVLVHEPADAGTKP